MPVQPSDEKQKLKSMIHEAREWNNRTSSLDNSSPKSRKFSWLKKIIIRISRLFMASQSEVNERVLDCLSLLTEEMVQSEAKDFQKRNNIDLEIGDIYERVLDRQPNSVEVSYWKGYIDSDNVSLGQIEAELTITPEYISQTLDECKTAVKFPDFQIYGMRSDILVAHEMIVHKRWEEHITPAFIKALKVGDVFLDIGANIGYYTLLAASIVKESGKVIAFEPNYINVQLLLSSIKENEFTNTIVYPLSASDTNAIDCLGTVGSNGRIMHDPNDKQLWIGNHLWIQSVVVDNLLESEQRIDVIKMDIELHEPFALRGMDKIVKKHRPMIFTEFHPRFLGKEYLEQIMQYDYQLSIIDYRLETLGEIIKAPNSDFIMDFWLQLNSPIQHLEILAEPK
jgi:FkbM family methyltransferase